MKTQPEAWLLVPDYSLKLAEAMAYAGLTPDALAARLRELGIQTSGKYIAALLRGGSNKNRSQPNPTLLLVAGIAIACNVPAQWFFSRTDEPIDYLIERYGIVADRLGS